MIGQWEAMLIAAPWVYQDARPGATPTMGLSEFDLGYVVWRVPPAEEPDQLDGGTVVVDRRNGELSYWPSLPAQRVAELYREHRGQTPPPPVTWDPVVQARQLRVRSPFPQHVTQLRLADGRVRIGRSMKGTGTPNLHRLVREVLDAVPAGERVRGDDRCSEVAVLSDLLHAEDAHRAVAGEPPVSTETARTGLLRGADIVTHQVLERRNPLGGQTAPPCRTCRTLLRRFGFTPTPVPEPGRG